MNKTFVPFILLITLFLFSCQSIKDGLSGKKGTNSDEFLVKKKNPLVIPPKYMELPEPKSSNIVNTLESIEEDSKIDGLSFLPGHIRNLNQSIEKFSPPSNIGYSRLNACKTEGLGQYEKFIGEHFYFMHSFGLVDDELATDQKLYINFNDQEVLAMFHHQNLVGIQFHPERSGKPGVELLSSIVKEFNL